jgi:hypothetical protein
MREEKRSRPSTAHITAHIGMKEEGSNWKLEDMYTHISD